MKRSDAVDIGSLEEHGASSLLDLVIVGAGPHALALYTRLMDDNPDASASYFVAMPSQPRPAASRQKLSKKRCKSSAFRKDFSRRVAVIDPAGRWCCQWDRQFSALQIPYLRSTPDVHPGSFDSAALETFAKVKRRDGEFRPFDSERSKQARDVAFSAPSADLFFDFCAHLVRNYGIQDVVREGKVKDIEPMADGTFCVHLHSRQVLRTRRVVVATGGTTVPRIPAWAKEAGGPDGSLVHAWDLVKCSCAHGIPKTTDNPGLQKWRQQEKAACTWSTTLKAEQPRILIVGGGLTSLHLFQCAVEKHGVRHVHLVTKSDSFSVKQFDIGLDWVGWLTRPGLLSKFLNQTNFEERLSMLRSARGRGSVTPEALLRLQRTLHKYEKARESGSDEWDLRVDEGLGVEAVMWMDDEHFAFEGSGGEWEVYFTDGSIGHYDKIWLCTGSNLSAKDDPLLGSLLAQRPIDLVGGLPVLEPTLRWNRETEVYIMGAFAGLQLGPDALNLAGARTGSVRIDKAIRDLVRKGGDGEAIEISKLSLKSSKSNQNVCLSVKCRRGACCNHINRM